MATAWLVGNQVLLPFPKGLVVDIMSWSVAFLSKMDALLAHGPADLPESFLDSLSNKTPIICPQSMPCSSYSRRQKELAVQVDLNSASVLLDLHP